MGSAALQRRSRCTLTSPREPCSARRISSTIARSSSALISLRPRSGPNGMAASLVKAARVDSRRVRLDSRRPMHLRAATSASLLALAAACGGEQAEAPTPAPAAEPTAMPEPTADPSFLEQYAVTYRFNQGHPGSI